MITNYCPYDTPIVIESIDNKFEHGCPITDGMVGTKEMKSMSYNVSPTSVGPQGASASIFIYSITTNTRALQIKN